MWIDAEIGSVRYRYHVDPEWAEYEITGVSAEHVGALLRAEETSGYSAAATVKVLTYLHRNEHFDSAGRLAAPAPGWERGERAADSPAAPSAADPSAAGKSAIDKQGHIRI